MIDIQNTLSHFRNYKHNISVKEEIEFIQENDEFVACHNCYLGSSGKSTGVYNTSTGTIPFTNGLCPVCKGTGEISDLARKTVKCFSRKTSNEFIKNSLGVNKDTVKVVFVKMSDIDEEFNLNEAMSVKFSNNEEYAVSQILQPSFYSDIYQISLSGNGG